MGLISGRTIQMFMAICIAITLCNAQDIDGQSKPPFRPQEPVPPYPYIAEEVTFENQAAGVTLAGTLTLPETGNCFTAVILVTGSGPQSRDEEVMGHKPFLVISDYLTRSGIAVLRYDDRGVAQSTGDFEAATMADFADDAQCALEYLKTRVEINPAKIGLLGHSEGGTVIPIVASRSADVAFIISLAGVALPGVESILLQQETMWRLTGVPEEIIADLIRLNRKTFDVILNTDKFLSEADIVDRLIDMDLENEISAELAEFGMHAEKYIRQFAPQLATHAMQYTIRHDPAPVLEKVKCPVFAANGAKDIQVISGGNLAAFRESLKKGGNNNITIKEYPDMNHLFQECITGFFDEYAAIEHTISPVVLEDLADWILKQ